MKIEYRKLIILINYFKSNLQIYTKSKILANLLNVNLDVIVLLVNKIRSLGYDIEFDNVSGYKLNKVTDEMLPWEVKCNLQTQILGTKIYYFDKLFSTQDFALKILHKHENGAVIISKTQINGRGRYGRKWISDQGSLCFSMIIYPDMNIRSISFFPIISALALLITIEKHIKLKPTIKYPNDIMINDTKIAGILIDASMESNIINHIIIGFGINFNIDINSINNKLTKIGCKYNAGTLFRAKTTLTQIQFLQILLTEFERLINILHDKNFTYIIKTWNKYSNSTNQFDYSLI